MFIDCIVLFLNFSMVISITSCKQSQHSHYNFTDRDDEVMIDSDLRSASLVRVRLNKIQQQCFIEDVQKYTVQKRHHCLISLFRMVEMLENIKCYFTFSPQFWLTEKNPTLQPALCAICETTEAQTAFKLLFMLHHRAGNHHPPFFHPPRN